VKDEVKLGVLQSLYFVFMQQGSKSTNQKICSRVITISKEMTFVMKCCKRKYMEG